MRVEVRVARILKHLEQFRAISGEVFDTDPLFRSLPLQEGEHCLGVYENAPGQPEDSIAVTNFGLYVFHHGHWEVLRFDQMESIEGPESKENVTGLTVHIAGGRVVEIPIRGGSGKFRDAFEFLRFLKRVREDLQRRA